MQMLREIQVFWPDRIRIRFKFSRCCSKALETSSGICKDNGIPVFSWMILIYPLLKSISDHFSLAISPERNPIRVASLIIARFLLPESVSVFTASSTFLFHLWYKLLAVLFLSYIWEQFTVKLPVLG